MAAPPHRYAGVLAIGDELITGQKLDTNTRWLSDRLTGLGVRVVEHITLDDDRARIAHALRRLAPDVDLIVATGGLGPTADDLTRPALADAMGDELVEDADALRALEALAAGRGRPLGANRVQAERPGRGECLPNPNGSAPGLLGRVETPGGGCDVVCLPGPPGENRPMFDDAVVPRLRPPSGDVIATHVLHAYGVPESSAAARLGELMERGRNPVVGTNASGGVVTCRIRYEGPAGAADAELNDAADAVRERLAPHVFGEGDDTLPGAAVGLLGAHGRRLVVVESCTGGLLGALITGVPGSSDAFEGGWQTYSNEMKVRAVGVPAALVLDPANPEFVGAVSGPTARAMAEGALGAPGGGPADLALAITGVAGPGGGSAAKPVGTVYIALAARRPDDRPDTEIRRFRIAGAREDVRERAAMSALAMLVFRLRGDVVASMTWQVGSGG